MWFGEEMAKSRRQFLGKAAAGIIATASKKSAE